MTQQQTPAHSDKKKSGSFSELLSIIIQAIIIAAAFQTFLFQPFTIPSGSMRPTLLVGDYLFVSKYAYGYSKYSLPFSPNLFSGRIWASEPQHGDVIVFRPPNEPENYFIKRLVGLPGDRIQMKDGVLHINDKPVQRTKIGETIDADITGDITGIDCDYRQEMRKSASIYREKMDNGVEYNTFDICLTPQDNTVVYTIKPGHYFMMGDNRDGSNDSRFSVGQVPYENLVGRANLIFFSIGNDAVAWQLWKWPMDVRWSRLFSSVQTIKNIPTGIK